MTTPRLCTPDDREKVLEYVSAEPEMAVFITGDIEQFGMTDPVNVYAFERADGSWDGIVCKFFANFVCYARESRFDAEAMAGLIREQAGECFLGGVNGKYETVVALAPYLSELDMRTLNLAGLTEVAHDQIAPAPDGTTIRVLGEDDYDELFALLGSMDEYRGLYDDARSVAMAKKQRAADAEHGCITYGAFYEGELVSTAATSAASSSSAMVVSVGTRNDCRGFGLATAVVAKLCTDAVADGKRFLALFYDNPSAGRIYGRIGFHKCGRYAMLG